MAPGVDLAPAALDLANCELGLVSRLGREAVLKKALAGLKDYDVAILDTAPSIALLAVNALVAANAVIAPVVPDALGLRGLALFLSSLESIRSELNPSLLLLGVVVCMYDGRLTLHREALADLSAGNLTVLAIISKGIAAARSAGEGMPIAGGKLADQYFDLSKEIDQWLRNNP
jgi:chromosome partitioning protein